MSMSRRPVCESSAGCQQSRDQENESQSRSASTERRAVGSRLVRVVSSPRLAASTSPIREVSRALVLAGCPTDLNVLVCAESPSQSRAERALADPSLAAEDEDLLLDGLHPLADHRQVRVRGFRQVRRTHRLVRASVTRRRLASERRLRPLRRPRAIEPRRAARGPGKRGGRNVSRWRTSARPRTTHNRERKDRAGNVRGSVLVRLRGRRE